MYAFAVVLANASREYEYHENDVTWNKSVDDLEEHLITTTTGGSLQDEMVVKYKNYYRDKIKNLLMFTPEKSDSIHRQKIDRVAAQDDIPNSVLPIARINGARATNTTTEFIDHDKEFMNKLNSSSPTTKRISYKNLLEEYREVDRRDNAELRLGDLPHHVYMYKVVDDVYRAFCGGSIITHNRVISAANCLLTNKKNIRPGFKNGLRSVYVVGGILETHVDKPNYTNQQWRKIRKIYSQEFYRHPQYSLMIMEIHKRWDFNLFVNLIPFASRDYDFDGVCNAVSVKTSKSWAQLKQLYVSELKMLTRHDCQMIFMRSTRVFFCTEYDYNFVLYSVIPGGGLICQMTGDPLEVNVRRGILVAVTVQTEFQMPTLHQRIGMFYQWVVDSAFAIALSRRVLAIVIVVHMTANL